MPTIVSMSIQGKLEHPIMTNVISNNDRADYNRSSSGITKITSSNVSKINQAKGIPATPSQFSGAADGLRQTRQVGNSATVGLHEQSKGQNVNEVA